MPRPRFVAAVLTVSVLIPAGAAAAEGLDRALLTKAPDLLRWVKDQHWQNVGVLKFRVRKGDGPLTDNAGTLNRSAADRLELALVLVDDTSKPVGIVRHASDVAVRLRGANHLTADGRLALFAGRYPLAWGRAEVAPDGFLTGEVHVDEGLQDLTVVVQSFGKDDRDVTEVARFRAKCDADTLAQIGESFLLRGLFDSGRVTDPGHAVARIHKQEQAYPLEDDKSPVELQIFYGDHAVPLEIKNARALLPEPNAGEPVRFVLKLKDGVHSRVGVVLKVNGENTLGRQRQPDPQCRMWLLEPGDGSLTVDGFQLDDNQAVRFRVLSRPESKTHEINYGSDVGTITLSVFRERSRREQPKPTADEDVEELAAVARGVYPRKPAPNLAALQELLTPRTARGLIVEGEAVESKIRKVTFRRDPTPVMAATISYYRP